MNPWSLSTGGEVWHGRSSSLLQRFRHAARQRPRNRSDIGIADRRNDDGRVSGLFVIADRLTKSEIRASASLSTPEPMMMMRATV
jgi:hypothetical protein